MYQLYTRATVHGPEEVHGLADALMWTHKCSLYASVNMTLSFKLSLTLLLQDWMVGDLGVRQPDFLKGRNAVVWSREYSTENEARCNCDMLLETLLQLDGKRMIVGHTIQDSGINTACQEQVVRYGAHPSFLRCPLASLLTAPWNAGRRHCC